MSIELTIMTITTFILLYHFLFDFHLYLYLIVIQ